jgi:hypothetical protein
VRLDTFAYRQIPKDPPRVAIKRPHLSAVNF